MAKLLKLRFIDISDKGSRPVTEVYCDEKNRRGYFKRITKEQAKADDTTIKPTKKEIYEVRLLGVGWKNVSKTKFQKHLSIINSERLAKGWPLVLLPVEESAVS